MTAKVMDLSKCGGVCKGACKHYAIGLACPPEATYEPVEVKTARVSLEGIKEWMAETEGKGGIARRDHTEWLIAEVERLTRLNTSLLGGEVPVCGDCDGTGWLENRIDGRYPCTCMTEAEPYQILADALKKIGRIATGEDQVADDDTEGLMYIAKLVAEAVRP